jgi:hypothetical protein
MHTERPPSRVIDSHVISTATTEFLSTVSPLPLVLCLTLSLRYLFAFLLSLLITKYKKKAVAKKIVFSIVNGYIQVMAS